jgi:pimeloyl-ACP methyl ester carboxylesterase
MQAALPRMPDAREVTFDRCGHLPFIEHPDLFNATVIEFLDRAESP